MNQEKIDALEQMADYLRDTDDHPHDDVLILREAIAELRSKVRPAWWCCNADFGQHEPTCRNYVKEQVRCGGCQHSGICAVEDTKSKTTEQDIIYNWYCADAEART